ncbi:hypothetical protein ACHAWF_004297, partial [Thalassiosira exigua]
VPPRDCRARGRRGAPCPSRAAGGVGVRCSPPSWLDLCPGRRVDAVRDSGDRRRAMAALEPFEPLRPMELEAELVSELEPEHNIAVLESSVER